MSRFSSKPVGTAFKSTPTRSTLPGALSRQRLLLVWAFLLACNLGLGLKLYGLQAIQGEDLKARSQQQQLVEVRSFTPRRPIVDRQGATVASDRLAYTLYAHPKLFPVPITQVAKEIFPILNLPYGEVLQKLSEAESGIRLADALNATQAEQLAALRLDGLEMIQTARRLYPHGEVLAEVVGYADVDYQGQAGIEYSQQHLLVRPERSHWFRRIGIHSLLPVSPDGDPDSPSTSFSPLSKEGWRSPDDLRLQLTVDRRVQEAARAALGEQMRKFRPNRGAVVVMDVRDGALLALVTEPTYDPNRYYDYDVSLFKNWAVTDLYEPGSTFKPVNVAIALENDAIQPDSSFYDEGRIAIGEYPISNFDYKEMGARGTQTVTEIVQFSSNVGMVHVMEQLDPEVYHTWLEKLGLGTPLETDLPFTTTSQVKSRTDFLASRIEPATAAFGQGFSITTLQLAQVLGAIANGGKLVTPHTVRGLVDTYGHLHWQPSLPVLRHIFSQETTQIVLGMMEATVRDGTGKSAQIPGYRIAGKTGTAQKADPAGGYLDNAIVTSFVGILPSDRPQYLVLAVLDEPQGGTGSTTAAPIVKAVMEVLIALEGIPPS